MSVNECKLDLSIVILCFNEEIHIERCLRSALSISDNVYLVDSYSTDKTLEIAEKFDVKIYQYAWTKNSIWADKINWALSNLPFSTKWIMRLDSDEYVIGNFAVKMSQMLTTLPADINGIYIERRLYFLNKWMKHCGTSYKEIRIFKVGKALYSTKLLDEEIYMTKDEVISVDCTVADNPQVNLDIFISKHNGYSLNEAILIIDKEIGLFVNEESSNTSLFYKLPHYWRALALFIFRYFIKGGFLDGYRGFLWCFFQTLWYRILSDAKVDEIYSKTGKNRERIIKYLNETYNIVIK